MNRRKFIFSLGQQVVASALIAVYPWKSLSNTHKNKRKPSGEEEEEMNYLYCQSYGYPYSYPYSYSYSYSYGYSYGYPYGINCEKYYSIESDRQPDSEKKSHKKINKNYFEKLNNKK